MTTRTNDPETRGVTAAGEHVAGISERFDALIAQLPEEVEQADLLPDNGTDRAPERPRLALREIDGWPQRMIVANDPPKGAPWLAAFELAREAVAAAGIVLMHGKRGSGKTRMAAEIARNGEFPVTYRREAIPGGGTRKIPEKHAAYRSAMRSFLEIRATYAGSTDTELAVIDRLTQPGLLVIDELQERGNTPWEDRLLTHLIDCRYAAMRPTIIIANLTQTELQNALSPSVLDRVHEGGRRIEFTWDSYRRRK